MVVRRKKKVARRHKKSRFLKYIRGGNQFATQINILDQVEEHERQRNEKLKKEGKIKWWHLPSRLERWVNKDTLDPTMMEQLVGSYKYGNGDQKKLALDQLRIQLMINDIHEDPEDYIKAYQKGSHRRKGWVKNAARVGITAAALLGTGLGAYYFGIPGMIQSALTSAATTGAEAAAAKTLDGTLKQDVKSESMEGGLPSGVTSGASTTTTTTTPSTDYQQQIAEKAAETLGFTCSLDTQGQNLNSEQMEKCMAEYKEFLGYKPTESSVGPINPMEGIVEPIIPEDLPGKDSIHEEKSAHSDTYIPEILKGAIPEEEPWVEGDIEYGPEARPGPFGNQYDLTEAKIRLEHFPLNYKNYGSYREFNKEAMKHKLSIRPFRNYLKEYYANNISSDPVQADAGFANIRNYTSANNALMLHSSANPNANQQLGPYAKFDYGKSNENDPAFGTYSRKPVFQTKLHDNINYKGETVGKMTFGRRKTNRFFVPDNFFEQNAPTILNEKGEHVPNPNFVPSGDKDIVNNGFKPAKVEIGKNMGITTDNGANYLTSLPVGASENLKFDRNIASFDVNGVKVPLAYGLLENRYHYGYNKLFDLYKFWNPNLKKYVFVRSKDVVDYIKNNPKGFGQFTNYLRHALKKGKGFRFTKKGRKLYRRYRKHLKHSKKRTKH